MNASVVRKSEAGVSQEVAPRQGSQKHGSRKAAMRQVAEVQREGAAPRQANIPSARFSARRWQEPRGRKASEAVITAV